MSEWQKTACILCELNCGIEVKVGDNNTISKVRGDKAHPASKGYICNKATRLNHYQNGKDRVLAPLKRKADGSFEEVSWDTAITEIAQKMLDIKARHGADKLLYIGGGGQGNHMTGMYSSATRKAYGSVYATNAIAQEKTGEIYVYSQMLNAPMVRADFEHAQVGIFLGKNPWHSHGFHRARYVLKAMQKDPNRKMVVFDPRRSETADMADYHMAVKPGTDAWALAAIVAILVQEDWVNHDWIERHTDHFEDIKALFSDVPVAEYSRICGLEEQALRELACLIKDAESVAFWEDLGVQMNRHSTLVSYLGKLIWCLTGNFGKKGTQYIFSSLAPMANAKFDDNKRTPVSNARIISGFIPCNSVPEEVLSDHPDRMRAIWVDCSNPVYSYADSNKIAESLRTAELSVVVDIAMTETAVEADYILPTPTQFEKAEVSFFNFDFPHNVIQLRTAIFDAPETVLSEPEIHARLCEAMGLIPQDLVAELNALLKAKPEAFGAHFFAKVMASKELMAVAPVILYRTLGLTLPEGMAAAAPLSAVMLKYAMSNPENVQAAGHQGAGMKLGESLFKALLSQPSGIVFSHEEYDASFKRINRPGNRINLLIPALVGELNALKAGDDFRLPEDFPFVLCAGERREFTANGIYRDMTWKKMDLNGALRIHPDDASRYQVETGDEIRVVTKSGSATATVEVSDRMQVGTISLPNGSGITNGISGERVGVAPNELTDCDDRDFFAGTPWHKFVPARLEQVNS